MSLANIVNSIKQEVINLKDDKIDEDENKDENEENFPKNVTELKRKLEERSDYIPTKGHIYILKMFDTINNIIIYKICKSINFYKRYVEYTRNNYADIVIVMCSDDIYNDKVEIIKLFNQNCTLDKGKDYFQIIDNELALNLFLGYFSNQNNRLIETSTLTIS